MGYRGRNLKIMNIVRRLVNFKGKILRPSM